MYSVRWHLSARLGIDQSDCNAADHHMQLLSSSMDKTVIIWTPDHLSGVWMEKVNSPKIFSMPTFFFFLKISRSGLGRLEARLWGSMEVCFPPGGS